MTLTIKNGTVVVEHLGYSLETKAYVYDCVVQLENRVTDTDIHVHTRINMYMEDISYLANKLQSLFKNQISGLGFKSGDGVIDCLINKAEDEMYNLQLEFYDDGVNSIFQMNDTISHKELHSFYEEIKRHLNKLSSYKDSIIDVTLNPIHDNVFTFSMNKELMKDSNDMVIVYLSITSSFISMKVSVGLRLEDYLEKEKYYKLYISGIGLTYSIVEEFTNLKFTRFNKNKIMFSGSIYDYAMPNNKLTIKESQVLLRT